MQRKLGTSRRTAVDTLRSTWRPAKFEARTCQISPLFQTFDTVLAEESGVLEKSQKTQGIGMQPE